MSALVGEMSVPGIMCQDATTNQDGIYNAGDEKYTQYNIRSKGEIQINKSLLLENNTDVMIFRSHQPMVMYDRQNITRQQQHQGYPVTMEKNPDGTLDRGSRISDGQVL